MRQTINTEVADHSVNYGKGRRVRIYQDLSDLPDSYNCLFAESAAQSFFLSFPWFQNFCETALDPGDAIRIFGVEQEDSSSVPVAALVMRSQQSLARGFGPRTLSSLSNFYTSLYAPLITHSSYSPAVLEELAKTLSTASSPDWDAVDLKWLDRDGPLFSDLKHAFRTAGMVVQTYLCAGNWYFPVNGRTYQEYFEDLRSSVRNIARSKNKKVERSGRARVEIVTGLTGLEAALEAYERIYSSSWKGSEPYPQFIPGLVRTCAKQGWLRLGVVYVDGEPAAAQIWVISGGTASIYKMAYDKRFADLSVGSYLTTRMLEYALDVDKVREIDYLTGDDRYKKDWMSHRRERWGILALNPRTLRGTLAIARHIGGRAVKRGVLRLTSRLSGPDREAEQAVEARKKLSEEIQKGTD